LFVEVECVENGGYALGINTNEISELIPLADGITWLIMTSGSKYEVKSESGRPYALKAKEMEQ
jgi:hypothetical protein